MNHILDVAFLVAVMFWLYLAVRSSGVLKSKNSIDLQQRVFNIGLNDVIVITTERVLSIEQKQNIKAAWVDFQLGSKVFLLDGGLKLYVLKKSLVKAE